MRYRHGKSDFREYDFCHYELTKSEEMSNFEIDKLRKEATGGKVSIYFKMTKKSNIDVYIYGGKDRFSATEMIVEDNKQPEINKEYTVDVENGMLVVAVPKLDKDTEFAFNYWVAPYKEPVTTPWYEFEGE